MSKTLINVVVDIGVPETDATTLSESNKPEYRDEPLKKNKLMPKRIARTKSIFDFPKTANSYDPLCVSTDLVDPRLVCNYCVLPKISNSYDLSRFTVEFFDPRRVFNYCVLPRISNSYDLLSVSSDLVETGLVCNKCVLPKTSNSYDFSIASTDFSEP